MSTALVLRTRGMGDLLTAVPALRGLRRYGMRIVLATPPELSELAALTGVVDRLLPAREGEPLVWPGLTSRDSDLPFFPDVAVNLDGSGPESHRMLKEVRPRRLWAYACGEEFPRGPTWDDDEHEVTRWCRLLEWYGVNADPADLALPTPLGTSPAPGAVVIHPGGRAKDRRWPIERFAEVARVIAGEGLQVVITGDLSERPTALMVATRAVLPPNVVLAGRTTLRELCALIAGARLVVSSDTGVAHLATAYGAPSVVVFGPESPVRWGPPRDRPRHQAVWNGPDPADVHVDDVLKAAAQALRAAGRAA
ncbi:glycosyltransferase family 9 protein [Streptosporangiaceae bacterium NEAU-GS5]|nr:glycosyltransferase family 9 protein [Streptosporangiaceae bacterium NEAU-GS5]